MFVLRSYRKRTGETMDQGTILLVEDHDEIAELVRFYVEREGFTLIHARSGTEGLALFNERTPRLVLLDLGLPGMDGIVVSRTIRERSDVPIVMLTARDSETDTIVGFETGADDYVTKPFSPRELVVRIKAVLRRSEDRPVTRDVLAVAGFTVDAGRREIVTPDGDTVRPTPREFDLLWYLCEHTGLVLSRGQILEAVWGYDYLGETRTVDVHIKGLRKKLDGFPIETVWGVGYRVEPA
jgi:two-component system, OmpR family, response regulator RegX3